MSDARKIISGVLLRSSSIDFRDDGAFVGPVHADAILAALAEAGLVVVPRVPTEKMCLEVKRAFVNCTTIGEMWAGMIEAANEQ